MTEIQLTLISDSTGETVNLAAQAAASQFKGCRLEMEIYSFIGRPSDLENLPAEVWEKSDIVVFTLVRNDTRSALLERCKRHGIQAVALLDPLLTVLSGHIGCQPSSRPGEQYIVSADYFSKLSALDFAMQNDDGQSPDRLRNADVVLTGVSRTSKTPTCIYLAYQGIKAANIPLIYKSPAPSSLIEAIEAGRLVIGLTVSATRLVQVRTQRLQSLEREDVETYADRQRIEDEIVEARLLFARYDLPVIDVTRRSIEETAASIRNLIRLKASA
ncbi:pyruvate, water dikinase regulatory protein [Algicella marina]|uniref:Pyruvate, phosphate dikinase/phosphoenolpyruvate synthase regulator n=1 Tax=Algicella marina TaxID=2683284 RepID=A0A6P1T3K7_9RHOB|nr:pyruvate, water dikinase regulatory protein [Algicella marina]QHQ36597.1 pyruvate, phosphate dikinase/phosphoenolpyruvate synthase regulator [Algicella marina]